MPYLFLDEKVTKNQALYFLFKAARASQKPKLHKSAQLLLSIIQEYVLAPCAELIRFLALPASQENKAHGSIYEGVVAHCLFLKPTIGMDLSLHKNNLPSTCGGDTFKIVLKVVCPNEKFGLVKSDSMYMLRLMDSGKLKKGICIV